MFYDYEVELWKKGETIINDYGVTITSKPTFIKTIKCDIQPTSRELLQREYGIDEVCTKRMFCDNDTSITNNKIIKFKNEDYSISALIEWEDYYDIFLNRM